MILKAENIHKSYKENREKLDILTGIDLEVFHEDTIAITGESGNGKSTLLYILGLLDKPDKGKIYFENKEITYTEKNLAKFRNEQLGFIFQFHYLLSDFTLEENVAMPMFIKTKNIIQSKKEAGELLKKVHLYDRRFHYPAEISGGEQQRAAFARAIINKPKLILADEPTGNLDQKHSSEIINNIIQFNKEFGQTFVIVTHDLSFAKLMKKHFVLEKGHLNPFICE